MLSADYQGHYEHHRDPKGSKEERERGRVGGSEGGEVRIKGERERWVGGSEGGEGRSKEERGERENTRVSEGVGQQWCGVSVWAGI